MTKKEKKVVRDDHMNALQLEAKMWSLKKLFETTIWMRFNLERKMWSF